jgi:hypothetical protein
VVVVLGRPAAGGIQDDGFVGQPPIAVAGAAHAFDLAALGVGELQARCAKRGGLAGAGRSDDDVPGKQPKRVAALVAEARRLEPCDGFLKLDLHGRNFGLLIRTNVRPPRQIAQPLLDGAGRVAGGNGFVNRPRGEPQHDDRGDSDSGKEKRRDTVEDDRRGPGQCDKDGSKDVLEHGLTSNGLVCRREQ